MDGPVRIAIAGPGRSGTSLLVQLLAAWGFTTPDGPWIDGAEAGLEARLGSRPDLEVEKDPWAFEYIDRLEPSTLSEYDAFIIPVRRRQDAAVSRAVRDRVHRAISSEADHWRWDTYGVVAGGTVFETTAEAVGNTLGKALWDLLDVVSAAGLQPTILQFPRFALDFDYLWAQLGPIVRERVDEISARTQWETVVDPSKIRITTAHYDDTRVAELSAVVEELRTSARRALLAQHTAEHALDVARHENSVDVDALRQQLAHRDHEVDQLRTESARHGDLVKRLEQSAAAAQSEVTAMLSSRSWRVTSPIRALRRLGSR